MEWLKHANKSTEKCDICDTPYRFETIYDPNMPLTIPTRFLIDKMVAVVLLAVKQTLSLTLYVVGLTIQVPLFWMATLRLYTYAIDGRLPGPGPLWQYVIFGGIYSLWQHRLLALASYSLVQGLAWVILTIAITFALFIEHDWIARDEGFYRLLIKRLGKELRQLLMETILEKIQGAVAAGPEREAPEQRIARMAEMLNNFDAAVGENGFQQELRQFMQDHQWDNINANDDANAGANVRIENGIINPRRNRDNDDDDASDNDRDDDDEDDDDVMANAAPNFGGDDINGIPLDDDDIVPPNGVAEFLQLFGLTLDYTAPIVVVAICDIVIFLLLLLAYLAPHLIGNMVAKVFQIILGQIIPRLPQLPWKPQFTWQWQWLTPTGLTVREAGRLVQLFVINQFVQPVHAILMGLDKPPLVMQRVLVVSLGYALVAAVVARLMDGLIRGKRPVRGTARKVYLVYFETVITIKVFLVFAMEIFVFAVYCGFLLDVCAAPLFLRQVWNPETYNMRMLATMGAWRIGKHPILRVAMYWFFGTLYMLFFAHFVGMTRNHILRPGTLYFLRLPDDPNVRLIHDVIKRPFWFQVLRVWLSIKYYLVFIVAGIGGVTWGLRYLLYTPGKPQMILPTNSVGFITAILAILLGFVLLLPEFHLGFHRWHLWYWRHAFALGCHRLRLSHYILGKPVAAERGRVVYRNLWAQISDARPNYGDPVTYGEAQRRFSALPDLQACFVPDGTYLRVPANDAVLRRFLKKLFCDVTKDDKLINPTDSTTATNTPNNANATGDNGADYWTTEDETTEAVNNYDVVYCPPNLRLRWMGLLAILWMFCCVLVMLITFAALLIGRPFVHLANTIFMLWLLSQPDWRLADWGSLVCGLWILATVLRHYDDHQQRQQQRQAQAQANDGNDNNGEAAAAVDVAGAGANEVGDEGRGVEVENMVNVAVLVAVGVLALFAWIVWIFSAHLLCVDHPILMALAPGATPIRLYAQLVEQLERMGLKMMAFTPMLVAIHVMLLPFTIVPFMKVLARLHEVVGLINRPGPVWRRAVAVTRLDVVALNIAMVHIPAVLLQMVLVATGQFSRLVYVWLGSLAIFLMTKLAIKLLTFYAQVDRLVRNEKYVRGRAIQNVD